MHGWRARIGLIVPSSNSTNEPEFYQRLPSGTTLHTARMLYDTLSVEHQERMYEQGQEAAERLATTEVDVIAFGCTTGSLVTGEPTYALDLEERLAEAGDAPAVATAASILRAFTALELDSLVIHTPYPEEMNRRERDFIEAAGIDVLEIDGLGIRPGAEKGRINPEEVYRHVRDLDRSAADGVFVSCTNYRTFEILDRLERDLGKPVVSSNQALLWNTLAAAGIDDADVTLGRLFETAVPQLSLAEPAGAP
ncbi:MAG: maleate cis-trans isomerase [Salinirussus sp.]